MKFLLSIYKVFAFLLVSLSAFSSCVTLRPATVTLKNDISRYIRVYIPSTQMVHGTAAIVVSGMTLPYSQSVNPRDVIAGMLAKRGYIILNKLDERLLQETIIVNYGDSDRRNIRLGGIYDRSNTSIYFGSNVRIAMHYGSGRLWEYRSCRCEASCN